MKVIPRANNWVEVELENGQTIAVSDDRLGHLCLSVVRASKRQHLKVSVAVGQDNSPEIEGAAMLHITLQEAA